MPPATSSSRESAPNAETTPPMTQPHKPVSALLDSDSTVLETALLVVESMKSSAMDSAAAKLDTTLLAVSAVSAPGTKSTIRVSASAVFLAAVTTSSTSVSRSASAFPTFGRWLMVPAQLASFTPHMMRSPNLVSVIEDT